MLCISCGNEIRPGDNWCQRCGGSISKIDYLLNSDLVILLSGISRMKKHASFSISFNTKNGKWSFLQQNEQYGVFELDDLLNIEILTNHEITQKSSSAIPSAILGGVLFGRIGAVAGSLANRKKSTISEDNHYQIVLTINSVLKSSAILDCDNSDAAYRVITTFQMLKNNLLSIEKETN
ncbi:MAG: zinc ribbon domain-containing protein [Candidatus Izemoplasmatales bacterium]|nr:zinc ribbon domain-containing protein [Candidatus Izemoplasmatales bacterium]